MMILALALVLLHTVDDREVFVNPAFVVTTTEPKDGVDAKVNCVVGLLDTKFVSVRETCSEVNSILYGSPP